MDWPALDHFRLYERQTAVAIHIPCWRSSVALNLLVGSTGVKVPGNGDWRVRMQLLDRRQQWRVAPLAMDASVRDAQTVKFTYCREGDSPALPDRLAQIPPDQPIPTVTADGTYDTRKCHLVIMGRGGVAIIPIRRNGRTGEGNRPAVRARREI